MKKIIAILLSIIVGGCLALALVSCGKNGQANSMPTIEVGSDGYWYINGEKKAYISQGEQGEKGEKGEQGVQGKSAYEIFKENYPEYAGSEKEWITAVAKGDTCSLLGHDYDEGVITIPATKISEGKKTYTCKKCHNTKIEVIPKIEVADAEIYEVDGKKYVNLGSYPQNRISEASLIGELNNLTETNEKGYYAYRGKEYVKVMVTPHRFRVEFDDNIRYKYSDGAKVIQGIEWFRVEPLKWRVLEENLGSIKVISNVIIDITYYHSNKEYRTINGIQIAPNNYKYSKIRDFLNNSFYNRAFTATQQNAILVTEVDNSESTTADIPNQYACENTKDKVYLLSYSEMIKYSNYYNPIIEMEPDITDYAVAKYWNADSRSCGYWWLRSPESSISGDVRLIGYGGTCCNDGVNNFQCGIVPALQISAD